MSDFEQRLRRGLAHLGRSFWPSPDLPERIMRRTTQRERRHRRGYGILAAAADGACTATAQYPEPRVAAADADDYHHDDDLVAAALLDTFDGFADHQHNQLNDDVDDVDALPELTPPAAIVGIGA